MSKNILFYLCVCLFVSNFTFGQELSTEEQKLYHLIMEYRKENNLSEIPLSKSLTFVAQTHVNDLQNNQPEKGNCNMHSWSNKGDWSACCYTSDHAQAKCMWNKPKELTSYTGNGFEIASWRSTGISALNALIGWKKSPGHNEVILNKSIWKNSTWKAVGIGIYGNYAVVWFGDVVDNNK
jgi:hypothetical protein